MKTNQTNLGVMNGTVWDDFPNLLGHQVNELVDKERWRKCHDTTSWYSDKLPAYWTPEI